MIRRNYKKHLFYTGFATILAIGLLAMSERIVRSQRVDDIAPPPVKSGMPPSPFKFKGHLEPKNDLPNMISGLTSPGSLIEKSTADFSSSEYAEAVAVQADGKIVAAGSVRREVNTDAPNTDFAVFRYNPDGSLDTSFDGDGKVITPIGNEIFYGGYYDYDYAYAVAIQTDGKIVVAGNSDHYYLGPSAIVRYNTDGSLDASFGAGGIANVDVADSSGQLYSIAVQADGKIVAAGYTASCDEETCFFVDLALARLNSNGSLDTSFHGDGMLTTDFDSGYEYALDVVVQTDGKIIAAGYKTYGGIILARYHGDGSLDTSFDSDGRVSIVDFGAAYSVAVQSDGKIVISGLSCIEGNCDFALARLNTDGSLDTSFDGDGKLLTDFGNSEGASAVAIQSDGKIVAGGSSAVSRYNPDGSLDTSFDGDGKVTNVFGGASDLAIQANGKFVAAGGSSGDFALSRYNVDGSLDTAFDGDGKVTTAVLEVSTAANAAVVYESQTSAQGTAYLAGYSSDGTNDDFAIDGGDGKRIIPIGNADDRANAIAFTHSGLIAAGYSSNGSNKDFALVWYWQNSKVTTDFGGNEEAKAIAAQADKAVVAGQTDAGGGTALVLARYNYNRSLDTSFGTGGRVIFPAIQNPRAVAVQPDGKIIAAGNAPHTVAPFGDNFALARFLPDGSLDTSFDGDGIAVTRFDHSSRINSITIQIHGQIVAAGYTRNSAGTVSEFALARYNTNGTLDTTFDTDGKVTTSFGARSEANAVRIQRNSRIVAVGASHGGSTGNDFAVARYDPNGSLDTTFDTDGKQTTDFFGGDDTAVGAGFGRAGNIVVAGSASRDGKTHFAVALYIGDVPLSAIHDYDYDGDGWADISVFRPSTGDWYLNRSQAGLAGVRWGIAGDKIVPADYDHDSKTDIAVYRPSEGRWYILNSRDGTYWTSLWGEPPDIPIPFEGKIAIFRPSDGNWWVNGSFGSPNTINYQLGESGDHPIVGHFGGNALLDIAVFRPSTGVWYIRTSSTSTIGYQWGLSTDKVVPADYDGDGKTDIAVYRPAEGRWYILNSGGNPAHTAIQFGTAADVPVPADYDGDGKADIAIFRPSDGNWWINNSTAGLLVRQFGQNGDKPTPNAFGN